MKLNRIQNIFSATKSPNYKLDRGISEKYGIACSVIFGPEGNRANLFATIGPKEALGYILSSPIDVVPVEDHSRRPLEAMKWQRHSWKTASGKKFC